VTYVHGVVGVVGAPQLERIALVGLVGEDVGCPRSRFCSFVKFIATGRRRRDHKSVLINIDDA